MNKLTETAPERIWLHEIQWTNSGQVETVWRDYMPSVHAVAYVRADLLEAAQKRIAELEAQIEVLKAESEIQSNGVRVFYGELSAESCVGNELLTGK